MITERQYEVLAPVVSGSGVMVVHRALEAQLPDYRVKPLSPYWGLVPPLLAMRRSRPDQIVHSHPDLGPWIAHPDSPLVMTFHGYYLDPQTLEVSSGAQRVFYRTIMSHAVSASLRRAQWITTVSRYTADQICRRYPLKDRLILVRNGVDTSVFSPVEKAHESPVRILFAGNPTACKGVDHLMALPQSLPDDAVMQYTVGMRDSRVNQPVNAEKLIAIPRRKHSEMPSVYRQADVLFFPTRREGLSLVVLEAMACGLPIVTTRCSSMPELIDHGKGGFLFDMDDREQMLHYLKRLIADPMLRADMGAYNREKILAEFSLEKMLEGYRQIFSAIR